MHTQVSTILGVVIKQQREEKAWTEGVAIWVAVLVVSSVGKQQLGTRMQTDMHTRVISKDADNSVCAPVHAAHHNIQPQPEGNSK